MSEKESKQKQIEKINELRLLFQKGYNIYWGINGSSVDKKKGVSILEEAAHAGSQNAQWCLLFIYADLVNPCPSVFMR